MSDREQGERIRVDRRFRVASVSKTFLAAVVLQLAAERRLTLDDTVERWLPGGLPNGDRVTIRELLEQTSGIVDGTVEPQEPGTFQYANENYVRRDSGRSGTDDLGRRAPRPQRDISRRNRAQRNQPAACCRVGRGRAIVDRARRAAPIS